MKTSQPNQHSRMIFTIAESSSLRPRQILSTPPSSHTSLQNRTMLLMLLSALDPTGPQSDQPLQLIQDPLSDLAHLEQYYCQQPFNTHMVLGCIWYITGLMLIKLGEMFRSGKPFCLIYARLQCHISRFLISGTITLHSMFTSSYPKVLNTLKQQIECIWRSGKTFSLVLEKRQHL